jgi:hypothetical protein
MSQIMTKEIEKIDMPGLPETALSEELTNSNTDAPIFTLAYRKGNDILQMNFIYQNEDNSPPDKHFQKAIARGKRHCEIMRYRFLYCRPFITDLDVEEKRMSL